MNQLIIGWSPLIIVYIYMHIYKYNMLYLHSANKTVMEYISHIIDDAYIIHITITQMSYLLK
jgi:hypothetical protein